MRWLRAIGMMLTVLTLGTGSGFAHVRERIPVDFGAKLAAQRGSFAAARTILANQLQRCEAEPRKGDHCIDLLLALSNIATLETNLAAAEEYGRRALTVALESLPATHSDVATAHDNLGVTLAYRGKYREADAMLSRGLALRRAGLPARHATIARSLTNLAFSFTAQGRYREAEPLLNEALDIYSDATPRAYPMLATILSNLAGNLMEQERYAEAESHFRRVLELRRATLPAQHPDIATAHNNLATALAGRGGFDEAVAEYRAAFRIRVLLPIWHPDGINARFALARLLQRERESTPEAVTLYRIAARGVLERLASFKAFDEMGQAELRRQRPIFTGSVRAAWDLAQAAR